MKRMHEQLHLLGVRRVESVVPHPLKVVVVARASYKSALIPLSPAFLVPVSATRTPRCAT